jgi:DeoR family fructose operon transcriptional repressor
MSLILDTGSTALEVARELRRIGQLRVLTTSLPIAAEIHDAPGVELVLLGGTLRRGLPDLTGPLAERNLAEFRVDLAILGADAATREGIFTNDLSVARVTQGMIASAEEAILVVDHSKFARRSFVKYADWESFQTVITDAGLRTEDKDWLAPAVRELVVVAP